MIADTVDLRGFIARIDDLLLSVTVDTVAVCREYRNLGLTYGGHLSKADLPDDLKRWANHHIHKANLFAGMPDEKFEDHLRHTNLTVNYMRTQAQRCRVSQRRDEMRAAENHLSGDHAELYVADIRDVRELRTRAPDGRSAARADAVITDPPYEHPSVALFGDLVRFSNIVLRDHGWLVFMTGMAYLDEVFEKLNRACDQTNMQYVWTMALHTPGAASPQWIPTSRNSKAVVNPQWKPVLIYSKGQPEPWPGTDGVTDFLVSDGRIDKALDEWNQDEEVFRKLVRMFSAPGNLVAEPFLGGGTTAVAALAMGRTVEGFDINEDDVRGSIRRVADMERAPEQAVDVPAPIDGLWRNIE
jgi:hypothetical protein